MKERSIKKPKITFKRQESEKGLARVCQGTLPWIIRVDGKDCGRVSVRSLFGTAESSYAAPTEKRWFWHARVGDRLRNTASDDPMTADECKAEAKSWIVERFSCEEK